MVAYCYTESQRRQKSRLVGTRAGIAKDALDRLADARAEDRDHPHRVSAWIANVGDHLVEVGDGSLAGNGREFTDGLGIAIAPGFDDGREGFPRYAQGIHDDVVHGDLLQVHGRKDAEHVASDEKVCVGAGRETRRDLVPEIPRIERGALKVKHAVILREQVQITAAARHPRQFGDHALRVWDGMNDVTADGQIEALILRIEFENALVLEPQTSAE